jgi:peptidoglycan/xylan/chitin deacetylase (PgdA/CDA1 family)
LEIAKIDMKQINQRYLFVVNYFGNLKEMNKEIIAFTANLANHMGFFNMYGFMRRKFTKTQVAILMFHRVGPRSDNWSCEPLSLLSFERYISQFSKNQEIISLETLWRYLQEDKSLPEKAVIITFDDGYRDNFLYAYPILNKYKVPATIFLTTGHINSDKLFWWDKVGYLLQNSKVKQFSLFELGDYSLHSTKEISQAYFKISEGLKKVDEERKIFLIDKLREISGAGIPGGMAKELILSWEEIREMHNSGIKFGAHTVNHPILEKIPLEKAKWEISQSKKDIENILGVKVLDFAYPNGNYSDSILGYIKGVGFTGALSVFPWRLINSQNDIFRLTRTPLTGNDYEFKMMHSGFQEDFTNILKRLQLYKAN